MYRLIATLCLLLPATAFAGKIWLCQDLQQQPEFSSIQCAPDAKVYVPDPVNAGGTYGKTEAGDNRYRQFIDEHNRRLDNGKKAGKGGQNREGNNLDRFRNYPTR